MSSFCADLHFQEISILFQYVRSTLRQGRSPGACLYLSLFDYCKHKMPGGSLGTGFIFFISIAFSMPEYIAISGVTVLRIIQLHYPGNLCYILAADHPEALSVDSIYPLEEKTF
jgi:hypothetical protein